MRIIVLVSSDRSDLYFANQLIAQLPVCAVVVEHQESAPTPLNRKLAELARTPTSWIPTVLRSIRRRWRSRFAIYNRRGKKTDFGEDGQRLSPLSTCGVLDTKPGQSINDLEIVEWIASCKPDIIAVCGTSLLDSGILSLPKNGVLNLHGGLAQFYRGLFTTDWALHNEEPEYIGATVHYVSDGIDDGEIVFQGRPELERNDNPSTCYEKVVRLGVNMMIQAINDIANGSSEKCFLPVKGELYTMSMVSDAMRDRTWLRVRNGVISNYLHDRKERDARVTASLVNTFEQAD